MSERGRPDLSSTQLIASGLATATATVASSFLGVAGTIIGAAFMSVATTAGAAVYNYYLERGKRRYVTLVSTEIKHRVVGRAAHSEQAESAETRVEEPAETPEEPAEPAEARAQEPAETRAEEPAEAAETRAEEPAESKETAVLASEGIGGTRAGTRRPRWYVFAGAAVAIFAVVIGAITAVESLANKPVSAMLGKSDRSGTSLGDTFGGHGGPAPSPSPVVPSSTGTASPSTTAPSVPPGGSAQPSTAPVPPPDSPSAPATTRPPAPTPTTPSTRPTAP